MKQQYQAILKNKNYLMLFLADNISRFGDSLDAIVMTLLVYSLTHSASWAAVVFTVNRIPTIFIQPLAGTYIEKRDKKKMMVICDMVRALLVGVIATLLVLGSLRPWNILILTFLISTVESFRQPASMAILPQILSTEELEVGLSLSRGVSQAIELIGTGMAGFLIAWFKEAFVIYVDMLTFLFSAILIARLSLVKTMTCSRKKYFLEELKEGFLFMNHYPRIQLLIMLAVYINAVLTPFLALQAAIVEDIFHASSMMLSVMSMSLTCGLIVGSLVYPKVKERVRIKRLVIITVMMISITYIGICMIGFIVKNQWLLYGSVIILFFMTGFFIGCMNMFANTELLKSVLEEYLSRVTALMTSLCVCMTPLVSLGIGLVMGYMTLSMLLLSISLVNIMGFMIAFYKKLSLFE